METLEKLDYSKISNVQLDGIDYSDYPDFCDAFFSYAEYEDGTPLNDEELELLGDENGEMINQLALDRFNDQADYDYDMDR